MSQATLSKVESEVGRLQEDVNMYKKATTKSAACAKRAPRAAAPRALPERPRDDPGGSPSRAGTPRVDDAARARRLCQYIQENQNDDPFSAEYSGQPNPFHSSAHRNDICCTVS